MTLPRVIMAPDAFCIPRRSAFRTPGGFPPWPPGVRLWRVAGPQVHTRWMDVLGGTSHEPPPDLVCSARGCRAAAVWALRWNNPKLHTPDRRKTWLACDTHRQHLADHLTVRGFLKETVPAEDLTRTA